MPAEIVWSVEIEFNCLINEIESERRKNISALSQRIEQDAHFNLELFIAKYFKLFLGNNTLAQLSSNIKIKINIFNRRWF